MEKLIVDQALKVFAENSIIPELEAKIKELEKYKTLYENASITLRIINDKDPSDDIIVCFDCMKIISDDDYDNNAFYYCRACLDFICVDCKSTIPVKICSKCNKIYHLRCSDDYVCDDCNNCKICCKC